MAGLEIHPLSELRDEAASLLAERFARQREAEPLLPQIDDFGPHVPEDGLVATRGGEAVAYLAGAVEEESKMARWLFAGHAAREPEALRDLFAAQAGELGVSRFMVTVPASAPELLDVWFRLAFGCQAVWAVRETEAAAAVDFAGTIRPATTDDVEAIVDLDLILYAHQEATPSFSEFPPPPREQSRAEADELWVDPYVTFVAEQNGAVVGVLILYARPEGDLRVPARNIDLAFAATRAEVRGSGAGLALTAFALRYAHEHGYRSLTTDWRMVNLLSSRFWPNRGFRPQYLRLYRRVP
ncbi:MAG TPA: GNAT family N-acetyltransferase [Gaiellaceae bacterium]|nr:GNAT family N-acetyltransferase [Gaiellaceae bacterium]